MTEFETLQALQAKTGLIRDNPDRDAQVQAVAKFTRLAAWTLRDRGWGNLRKTAGANVRGLSIDKLIHGATGVVVDLCISSDSENPQLAWNLIDAVSTSLYVTPEPPDDVAPGGTTAPAPGAPPAAPAPTSDAIAPLTNVLAKILPVLDEIADGLHAAALEERPVSESTAARIADALERLTQRLDGVIALGKVFEMFAAPRQVAGGAGVEGARG